ncbi:RNA-binding protein [Kocuria coralli]|uniref:RNA-binding protein n=1 Tax=Kocuria coralli TaxID=1461025 RepID=A0A5J5KZ12_9MICC|nr:R3H domain-containing nucleic acid-binding protein [Kocuria coralli]KAA9394792.1 RNA-binding protein [Kocuria coralli]
MSNQANENIEEAVEVEDLQPGEQVDAAAVAAGVEVPADETSDDETSEAGTDGSEISDSETDSSAEAGDDGDPLVDEGEVAADYLEELLDLADLDGDIDIEVRNGRTYLSVLNEETSSEDLELLVGKDGEVLDSLQELVRLAVLASTDHRSRLVLDIAGHRERRAGALREMALKAMEEARSTGEAVHLDPLSPYERKIVHDVVAEGGLHSESEGEGSGRHIVVSVEG